MNHTPGPWIESNGDIIGPNNEIIASGKYDDSETGIGIFPEFIPIKSANSALITAAPELLEACKALPLNRSFEDAADFKDNASQFIKAMELAKIAIAKAEGRS